MIHSIKIKQVATYSNKIEQTIDSNKINFLYGNNGTGKTTITRLIEESSNPIFSNCNIDYDENGKCNTLVYNQDFVKINFNSEIQLRGIYTFGEESEEKYKQINLLNEKKETINSNISKILEEIKIKKEEIDKLRNSSSDIFWKKYRKKIMKNFQNYLKGTLEKKKCFLINALKPNL